MNGTTKTGVALRVRAGRSRSARRVPLAGPPLTDTSPDRDIECRHRWRDREPIGERPVERRAEASAFSHVHPGGGAVGA